MGYLARVKVVGAPSWLVTESVPELLHVALYVRDALRLPVAPEPGPPRLVDPVPDRRAVLSEAERTEAAEHWRGWWQALVEAQVCSQERWSQEPALQVWMTECGIDLERVGAPPEYLGLADRPALRAAALALDDEAHHWVSKTARAPERQVPLPWELVKGVAEAVASERRVSPDAVQATVLALAVAGRWWVEVHPGYVLASQMIRADPAAARVVLRRAFESRLGL